MPDSSLDRRLRDSSSSSSEELDASIYFRVGTLCKYDWYVIKNDSTTPEKKFLRPIFSQQPEDQTDSACAALGSTIYVFGGAEGGYYCITPEKFDDVYYINTHRPKNGWKKGPSMKKPRMCAHAVAVNGKIYVMGCTHESITWSPFAEISPWAEVFDPLCKDERNSWRALRYETPMPRFITGHAILDGGKRILVHSYRLPTLYSYDVEADSWEIYSQNLDGCKKTSAFVDGILYYRDTDRPEVILGFDVSKPESLPKPVTILGDDSDEQWLPESSYDDMYPPTHVLALGNGKLAVVWYLSGFVAGEPVVHVYCSKMKMHKEENAAGELDLVAYPLSHSVYYIHGSYLVDCMAVFASQNRETQEEVNKDDNLAASYTRDSASSNNNYNNDNKKKKKKNKNKNKKKK